MIRLKRSPPNPGNTMTRATKSHLDCKARAMSGALLIGSMDEKPQFPEEVSILRGLQYINPHLKKIHSDLGKVDLILTFRIEFFVLRPRHPLRSSQSLHDG